MRLAQIAVACPPYVSEWDHGSLIAIRAESRTGHTRWKAVNPCVITAAIRGNAMLKTTMKLAAVGLAAGLIATPAAVSAQEHPSVTFRHATGFPKALYMGQPAEHFAKRVAEG